MVCEKMQFGGEKAEKMEAVEKEEGKEKYILHEYRKWSAQDRKKLESVHGDVDKILDMVEDMRINLDKVLDALENQSGNVYIGRNAGFAVKPAKKITTEIVLNTQATILLVLLLASVIWGVLFV